MKKEFLGTGWKFPLTLDTEGSFLLVDNDEDIREAILIILNTSPGERVMQPEFGCSIQSYVFSVMNNTTLEQMRIEIQKALTLYEPRIIVEEVRIEAEGSAGKLLIHIDYTVQASNSRYNMVYPFYLTEKG